MNEKSSKNGSARNVLNEKRCRDRDLGLDKDVIVNALAPTTLEEA